MKDRGRHRPAFAFARPEVASDPENAQQDQEEGGHQGQQRPQDQVRQPRKAGQLHGPGVRRVRVVRWHKNRVVQVTFCKVMQVDLISNKNFYAKNNS